MLNDEVIYSYTGMFKPAKVELLNAKKGDILKVVIHPAPKHDLNDEPNDPNIKRFSKMSRSEADRAFKPGMQYGWDCHPRLITQGIYKDAYFYLREPLYIDGVTISYRVVGKIEDCSAQVKVNVSVDSNAKDFVYELSLDGQTVFTSNTPDFTTKVDLWYPTGYGKQVVYDLIVKNNDSKNPISYSKKIGFRKAQLIMNDGAWKKSLGAPYGYPLSRAPHPFQLVINDKKVFAKGSNWVSPEVFLCDVTKDRAKELFVLAKDGNMNIFRMHGGSAVSSDYVFDVADELGIMIWQEFPLACNTYDGDEYLKVLDEESKYLVSSLKNHPSIILWCGGNELFNDWSGMTDESLALRTLNKNCLDNDPYTPFIMTSPVLGASHGHYSFKKTWVEKTYAEVMTRYNCCHNTGYVEYGVPALSSYETLQKIIPQDELELFDRTPAWLIHHGFDVFLAQSWGEKETIDEYFGKQNCLKDYIEKGQMMQCIGLGYIFEEARRQAPYCAWALNWDYNDSWPSAANLSIVEYPAKPKPAYYRVKDALESITTSLRHEKFTYTLDDVFNGEVYILNDSDLYSGINKIDVDLEISSKLRIASFDVKDDFNNIKVGDISIKLSDYLTKEDYLKVNGAGNILCKIILTFNGKEKSYPFVISLNKD
jgi:beta-mannosidase